MSPEALVKNKESLDDDLFESIFFIIASKLRIFNAFKKAELEIQEELTQQQNYPLQLC